MSKAQLVQEAADQTGPTQKVSREAVDAIISVITDCLWRGERVTLVGFGTFGVMRRNTKFADQILRQPPKALGATLVIRYELPR
ncbi:hypothetical protein E3J84_05875 [Candidatus Aerophobetes bacterium]|uniref:HU family DNA-binding protein n=1 Tax=Aerophobetes bacterium TaxID=2030807 RepID=A0A523RSK7_UNCAE|nr:MAG: hypothetical protein E3J84_05875 [Candidatus Aerophobetes bacterium]